MEKVHLIVGAGSGIGLEISKKLITSPDSYVLGVGRKRESLSYLSSIPNGRAEIVDVTTQEGVKGLFETIAALQKPLASVVNCAGSVVLKPTHLATLDEFNATIAVNLTSCFLLTKFGIPLMTAGGGSFLFFSTAAVKAGLANHDLIGAAKAGVEGFTRMCAATYASKNIRFNAIAPGLVKTPLTQRIHSSPTASESSRQMHALGRFGEPEQIASLACWLLSDDAAYMSGETINFDGGLALKTKAP
jgi:NAD(P)-dependent dehydrogenase (short-subunit alcohol dehydrogenase family)